MTELLSRPSVEERCSVFPKLVSKLSKPAADDASIFFEAASWTSELISRTDSVSRCAVNVPAGPSTSMPFRNVPAHNLPCESTDNSEIRLLVSDWRPSPQREKRIASDWPRWTPSLLSSHTSRSTIASLAPVEAATLFQLAGIIRLI